MKTTKAEAIKELKNIFELRQSIYPAMIRKGEIHKIQAQRKLSRIKKAIELLEGESERPQVNGALLF